MQYFTIVLGDKLFHKKKLSTTFTNVFHFMSFVHASCYCFQLAQSFIVFLVFFNFTGYITEFNIVFILFIVILSGQWVVCVNTLGIPLM